MRGRGNRQRITRRFGMFAQKHERANDQKRTDDISDGVENARIDAEPIIFDIANEIAKEAAIAEEGIRATQIAPTSPHERAKSFSRCLALDRFVFIRDVMAFPKYLKRGPFSSCIISYSLWPKQLKTCLISGQKRREANLSFFSFS